MTDINQLQTDILAYDGGDPTDLLSRAYNLIEELRPQGPKCVCCGQPAPKYQDRHGDDWCDFCHDSGMCSVEDGHFPAVFP